MSIDVEALIALLDNRQMPDDATPRVTLGELREMRARLVPAEDEHAPHFDPDCEECAYLARPTRETLIPAKDAEPVDYLAEKDRSAAEHDDRRSECPRCGEWRDSPTSDCAACGYPGARHRSRVRP